MSWQIPLALRVAPLVLPVIFLVRIAIAAEPGPDACLPVLGDRIMSGDLIQASGVFRGLPRDLMIGFAPLPGAQRVLRTEDLVRLAARYGVVLEGTLDPVCFAIPVEPMESGQIEAALRRAFGIEPGSSALELVDYSRSPVPKGRLEFLKSGFNGRPHDGAVVCSGRMWYGERRSVPVWARVRLRVPAARVVTTQDLKAGMAITAEQVRREVVAGIRTPDDVLSELEDVVGFVPRRAIRAGTALAPPMLVRPKDVERGDIVEVEVTSGAAILRFPAKADAGGRRGDQIVLINRESGRKFAATIDGHGRASMSVSSPATDVVSHGEGNQE